MGAELTGELEGFGNVNEIPTEIFPVSFVGLALNDQIFIYSINKSSAGPFSFRWAGLPTGGLQASYVCEEQASGASVLFFPPGYRKCLVLWALPPLEELGGVIPGVMLCLETL